MIDNLNTGESGAPKVWSLRVEEYRSFYLTMQKQPQPPDPFAETVVTLS